MVPMSDCVLEEQHMKDCGISITALTLSFVTALPHFLFEICVQIHHKHLVVRVLLVSWLCWAGLPGES